MRTYRFVFRSILRPVSWLGAGAALVALLACGPMGRFPGGRLHGEVVPGPVEDWSFTDEHPLIEVETRPDFPHSVTTICFTHEGRLYVPSRAPETKHWPFYVLEDPSVRLGIGDRVYLGRAVRVTDPAEIEAAFGGLARKYPQFAQREGPRPEVWLFRIEPPA